MGAVFANWGDAAMKTFLKSGRSAAAIAVGLIGAAALAGAASGQTSKGVAATPLTLLQLMRANVEIPADGVWAAQSADKLSDQDWLLAKQDAVNVIASPSFIASAGDGPKDRERQANADYQAWARDVQDTGIKLLAAVKAKDKMKLSDAADHLSEVCQNCHDKYRPEIPSDGVQRFPFYLARGSSRRGEEAILSRGAGGSTIRPPSAPS
jgi:hypothetical protein